MIPLLIIKLKQPLFLSSASSSSNGNRVLKFKTNSVYNIMIWCNNASLALIIPIVYQNKLYFFTKYNGKCRCVNAEPYGNEIKIRLVSVNNRY